MSGNVVKYRAIKQQNTYISHPETDEASMKRHLHGPSAIKHGICFKEMGIINSLSN